MAGKNVALPDGSVVAFPDGMSDGDIGDAIQRHQLETSNEGLAAPAKPNVSVAPLDSAPTRAATSFGASFAGMPSSIKNMLTQPPAAPEIPMSTDVPGQGALKYITNFGHDLAASFGNAAAAASPVNINPGSAPKNATIPQALRAAVSPENIGATAANVAPAALSALGGAKTAPTEDVLPERPPAPIRNASAGAENIFRAAAPTGTNIGFRDNLTAAQGDLAEIGRKLDLPAAKGSGRIANTFTDGVPDTRVRATVKGINDHLSDMYNSERAPQIQRNATAAVTTDFGPDAQNGLQDLTKHAGLVADKAVVARVLGNPSATLADMDKLARVVNSNLRAFEDMTPAEQAQAVTTRPGMAGLKSLDQELSGKIADELGRRGEGGIQQYERRYAGLSQVRDQLQTRMNASELARPKINPLDLVRKPSLASASQAALTGESPGKLLQKGFSQLAKSGATANRAVGTGAPSIAGLLGPGATRLPSEMEPFGDTTPTPPTLPYQPSLQQPPQFIPPGAIRPAAPEPQLLPPGEPLQDPNAPQQDLFQQRVPGVIERAAKVRKTLPVKK